MFYTGKCSCGAITVTRVEGVKLVAQVSMKEGTSERIKAEYDLPEVDEGYPCCDHCVNHWG